MENLSQFFQSNTTVIIIFLVAALPICWVYREYTWPVFFHMIEGAIYASVFHAFLSGFVRLAGWFKESSSFERIAVNWTTPLFAPWNQQGYNPPWVFWVNVVAWVLIAYIIIVIRPVGTKNKYRREFDAGAQKKAGGRPATATRQTYRGGRQRATQQSRRR